jgi:acetoin utilization deacetylase AcuC-like enzyme
VGYTLNVPLPAGSRDADFERAYEEVVIPALDRFKPEAILVSAGFDAHELDPLAMMRMSAAGYGRLVALIDAAARRLCGRRLALVSEGGYHLEALAECLRAVAGALSI